jgi:hypothetical protein
MSCFALSRVTNTTYPVSQLFKDLADTIPAAFCSPESSAFQIVHLYQDKDGVKPVKSNDDHSCFIKDRVTGELYWNDPEEVVRAKSAGLILGIPLLTAGVIIWHASQLIISIGIIALRVLENIYNLSRGKELCDCEISQLPCILFERLKGVITAPFYGVAMQVAALFAACIKPYHGRKLVAMIEHAWRNGVSYAKDCHCEQDMNRVEAFYLGWCFQVRGRVTLSEEGDCLESSESLVKSPQSPSQRIKIDWMRQSSTSTSSAEFRARTSS